MISGKSNSTIKEMLNFNSLSTRIKDAKRKLNDLWDLKGETDTEVLQASEEVDALINEYYRIFRMNKNDLN